MAPLIGRAGCRGGVREQLRTLALDACMSAISACGSDLTEADCQRVQRLGVFFGVVLTWARGPGGVAWYAKRIEDQRPECVGGLDSLVAYLQSLPELGKARGDAAVPPIALGKVNRATKQRMFRRSRMARGQ